jgi:ribosomal protein RSM22 (predicted rRNA methylase)
MKLSTLFPYLLHKFKSEHDLVKAIEELSLNFTQKREKIGDYLKDERLTSAYTAFYLTTNMPKLEAVFNWMPEAWVQSLKNATFVDIGSGPGTFSLAFRAWANSPVKVMQVETSQLMREQAQRIWNGLYPNEKLLHKPDGETILFFGHSANEMGVDAALRYIKEFNPDHILFVEPGTKDFFPKMLQIRDALIKQGHHILFPCPNSLECPLKNSEEDWCHQFIQVKQGADVERLSQMVKKDRRYLPLIVHAFSKTFKSDNPSSRVIRVLPETKFSYEWESCELNQLEHYQIMKRGLNKGELKTLSETLAGAALEVEVEKELENSKRVKIKSLNNSPL